MLDKFASLKHRTVPTTLPQIASSDPIDAACPTVQGQVEVLLDDHSLVRGILLPFRENDSFVEVAMDADDSTLPPMRLRRDSLRALKLVGWPNASILEAVPRPFRFEFNDGEVLAGECVSATPGRRGAWVRAVLGGGLKEHSTACSTIATVWTRSPERRWPTCQCTRSGSDSRPN